jgi:hypothetical protein
MGWRTATTFNPLAMRISMMRREVWLLPHPVRTAPTEMTGLLLLSMVSFGPGSTKLAPAACTTAATFMTCW